MRLLFLLFILLVTSIPVSAQPVIGTVCGTGQAGPNQWGPCRSINFVVNGYQQLTSISAATALTVPAGSNIAEICVEANSVRYRDDGTNPTTTVGMLIAAGVCFQYSVSLSVTAVTDNTTDIGASGANRPRDLFLARNAAIAGAIINTGITADTAHTDSTVCQDTTSHQFYSGTGAAGICLGTSSIRFKSDIAPLQAGLVDVLKVDTISYRYLPGYGDPSRKLYGFSAEQMAEAIPELVGYDQEGRPNSVDWAGMVPVLVRAVKEQQAEIENLKARMR